MNWNGLWHEFLNGHTAAVSAIFSALSSFFTFFGLIYVGRGFVKQANINHLILEKDRREIRPIFKVKETTYPNEFSFYVQIALANAIAFDIVITEFDNEKTVVNKKKHGSLTPTEIYSFEYKSDQGIPELLLSIAFKDEAGRKYFSELHTNGKKPYLTFPSLVDQKPLYKRLINRS